VRLNTEATPEEVRKLEPCAVFVAAGATPVVPASIPGIHGSNVCVFTDVLAGAAEISGKKAVVAGCGMNGLETAEYLAEKGNAVSAYDMLPEVAPGEIFQNIIDIETRIGGLVPQHTLHKLVSVHEAGCVFENLADGSTVEAPCDVVVLAMGMAPQERLAEQFKGFPNLRVIGANVAYGSIASAVESAYMAAYTL
jgi:pyruvate/2-oxoglutarate dehydrogenase complex dihydrolipoamide dehydrogenase (E3) component